MLVQIASLIFVSVLIVGAVVVVVRLNRGHRSRVEIESILKQLITDGAFRPLGESVLGPDLGLIAVHTPPEMKPTLLHALTLQEAGNDREAIEETMTAYESVLPDQAKSLFYAHAGNGFGRLGLYYEAKRCYLVAVAAARACQYPSAEGATLIALSMLADASDDATPDDARHYGEDALKVYQSAADEPRIAQTQSYLASLARRRGDLDLADARYREALEIYVRQSNNLGRAHSLNGIGNICLQRGELDQARKHAEEALTIDQRGGNRSGEAADLATLGEVHEQLGNTDAAREHYRDARIRFEALGNERAVTWVDERLANIGT